MNYQIRRRRSGCWVEKWQIELAYVYVYVYVINTVTVINGRFSLDTFMIMTGCYLPHN